MPGLRAQVGIHVKGENYPEVDSFPPRGWRQYAARERNCAAEYTVASRMRAQEGTVHRERVRIISGLLVAGCLAGLLPGKVAVHAAESAAALPAAEAKQQVIALEERWVEAENKHDAATLERILDDKFLATFGARAPRDKATFIQHITAGAADPTQSQTLTERTVIVDGDTAVSIGTDTISGTANGAAYSAAYRYTVTYIRRNGRWRALAEHMVEAPKGK